jgi:acetoin utilization deacetylase AcuC-like enzyme
MLKTFYHPGFAAPLGKGHIMPMNKFALVAEELQHDSDIQIIPPQPVQKEDLLRVHSKAYIEAIQTGEPRTLAESQKFPWTPQLYPSVLLTSGGILAAATEALRSGVSAALVSGFHHSHQNRGEGFCTFNGLIVALEALRTQGKISTAAILDMDLHYGNGTALLLNSRPWITGLSLYGNDYWENTAYRDVTTLRHQDGSNHFSAALPEKCDQKTLLEIMELHLPKLTQYSKPDLLLFQAGADPYYEDPYSPLSLNHEDLFIRDCKVFDFCKSNGIAVAWVLAGGYTSDISKVVQVHINTFRAWKRVYGKRSILCSVET